MWSLYCSFVRSVTMDKWKDIELEKMKAGGNGKFRMFLELQDDYDATWTMQDKYNSRPAALFRDKVRKPPFWVIILMVMYIIKLLGTLQIIISEFPMLISNSTSVMVSLTEMHASLFYWQVATIAEGKEWSIETSSAKDWTPSQAKTGLSSSHR